MQKDAGENRFDRTKAHEKLVNQCLLELTTDGFLCWKNNSGAVKTSDRYQRYGLKGSSDILAVAAGGMFWAIEIKTGKAVQNKSQKAFQKAVELRGGIYLLIHSLEELRSYL